MSAEPFQELPTDPPSTVPSRPVDHRRPPRRWMRWLWLLLPVLAMTVFGVGYLLLAIRREPQFYRESRAALQDAGVRKVAVEEFTSRTEELAAATRQPAEWRIEFTERQINAWLLEELPKHMRPRDQELLREPLVDLQPNLIRLGAKVTTAQYEGLLSLDVQPTVLEDESLSLVVTSIRAGDLPIPAGRLIGEALRYVDESRLNVEIETEPELKITIPLRKLIRGSPRPRLAGMDVGTDVLAIRGQGAAAGSGAGDP